MGLWAIPFDGVSVFCATGVVSALWDDGSAKSGRTNAPTAKPLMRPENAKRQRAIEAMVRDWALKLFVELRADILFMGLSLLMLLYMLCVSIIA